MPHLLPIPLMLSRNEARVVRRSLKRLRYEASKSALRNAEKGWQPEPGRCDLNRVTLEIIEELMERVPDPDQETVS
jgi:hypothetical protein